MLKKKRDNIAKAKGNLPTFSIHISPNINEDNGNNEDRTGTKINLTDIYDIWKMKYRRKINGNIVDTIEILYMTVCQ